MSCPKETRSRGVTIPAETPEDGLPMRTGKLNAGFARGARGPTLSGAHLFGVPVPQECDHRHDRLLHARWLKTTGGCREEGTVPLTGTYNPGDLIRFGVNRGGR
jgi:hypothetical protein